MHERNKQKRNSLFVSERYAEHPKTALSEKIFRKINIYLLQRRIREK